MCHTLPYQPNHWILALLGGLMAFHGTQSRAALTSDQWDHCRDRVIATVEAAGERDLGDVSAYTGASGAGVLDVVIEQCGYRPEQLGPADCDILYEQVYESCHEDGFEEMSVSATSWVMIYDPNGALIERLRLICAEPIPVSRESFGRLVCGESRPSQSRGHSLPEGRSCYLAVDKRPGMERLAPVRISRADPV